MFHYKPSSYGGTSIYGNSFGIPDIIAMVLTPRAMPAGTTNMGVLRRRFQCSNCRTAKLTISPISPGEWAGCHQQYDMVVLKISTLYRMYQGIAVGQTVKPYNPSWLVVWNMNGLFF
jgi:hypothetical protein